MSQTCENGDGVPGYVKEFINKIADREGFTDYSITNSAGSNAGDGFMGDLLRFKINGKQNNVFSTLSLICKTSPTDPLRRAEFNSDRTFAREILMYEYVLPYFIEFQKEQGVSEADGFYSFPKCYGTILDDRLNGDHAIILEDLIVNNYYLWDKLKNIDFDRARLVMEKLGKLHAVSFAIRDKNPEKLNEFRTKAVNGHHRSIYNNPMAMEFLSANINRAISSLEQHEVKLIEKLQAMLEGDNSLEIIDQVFSNTTPEPFGVIVHGDMWNNNIMYQNGDKDEPSNVMFIDWQLSQFGSPALDVAHYIFCSLDENIRSKHYNQLVECYYNSLSQTLKKFGCDDQKLFTLADLKDQFSKYGRTCLFAGPILSQIMTTDPANLPNIDEVLQQIHNSKENGEIVNPADVFGAPSESYKPRISGLLRDLEREGLI